MKAGRGSYERRTSLVSNAIRILRGDDTHDWYVEETHPDFAIVRNWKENKIWKVSYTLDEEAETVSLGEWVEQQQIYIDVVGKQIRMIVPVAKGANPPPRRITLGVVLEPDSEDLQGDVMKALDIELAAHDFMIESQQAGAMHAEVVKGAKVVESYIAPCDFEVETADGPERVLKGSWLLAIKWPPEQWEKIEKGEYTGYSVGGQGVRIPVEEEEGDG